MIVAREHCEYHVKYRKLVSRCACGKTPFSEEAVCEKTQDSVSDNVRGKDVLKVFVQANAAKNTPSLFFESGEARAILRKTTAKGLSCRNPVDNCTRRAKSLSARSPRESCRYEDSRGDRQNRPFARLPAYTRSILRASPLSKNRDGPRCVLHSCYCSAIHES